MSTASTKSKMKPISQSRIWLLIAGTLLMTGWWWGRYVQTLNGRSLSLSPDSLVWLGISLIGGVLFERIFPDSIINVIQGGFRWVRRHFVFLSLIFLPLILATIYAVNRFILHSFMNSADEHSCYFLAECLRMGKWWETPHPLSEFFNVVHVGNRDGKWFSVYPPGWPAIWALGLEWNVVNWLNPVMATFSLILLFKAGRRVIGFSAAWFGLGSMAITPFFLFTSASYFSHTTCLLMVAIFLYSILKWEESSSEGWRIFWVTLAGLAGGYGLATRYLTMLAIMTPFIAYRIYRLVTRRDRWTTSHTVFAVIMVVSIVLIFSHNHMITGKWSKAPNRYDKRWEKLGFRSDYTILDGLIYILARLFYLAQWFPPAFIALFLFFWTQKRSLPATAQIYRFGLLCPVIAYFFYYSWGGNQYGPRYYYEGLPFLAFSLSEGLRANWQAGSTATKKILTGLVLVGLLNAPYQIYKQGVYFETASRERKALYDLADQSIQSPAIVFIHGFIGDTLVMAEEDAVRNSPALNARILYAHDLGDKNQLLKDYYPNRMYYRGSFDRSTKQAKLEKI